MLVRTHSIAQGYSGLELETVSFGDRHIAYHISRSCLLLTKDDEQRLKAEVPLLTDGFLHCGLPLYLELGGGKYKKATPDRIRLWAQQALKADLKNYGSVCNPALKLTFWSHLETFSGQVTWIASNWIQDTDVLPWI